jgi:hypothetical protein
MSKVTYLNVDALVPLKKTIELFGKVHEMHTISVGEFIELTTVSKEIDQVDFAALPISEQMLKLIQNVKAAFPTVDEADLKRLTVEQLTAIIKFISGLLEEEVEAQEFAKQAQEGEEKNA